MICATQMYTLLEVLWYVHVYHNFDSLMYFVSTRSCSIERTLHYILLYVTSHVYVLYALDVFTLLLQQCAATADSQSTAWEMGINAIYEAMRQTEREIAILQPSQERCGDAALIAATAAYTVYIATASCCSCVLTLCCCTQLWWAHVGVHCCSVLHRLVTCTWLRQGELWGWY